MASTLSYSAALETLKLVSRDNLVSRRSTESPDRVALANSPGRVSALDIQAPASTPEFDTSAMDGYAIRSEATRHASPYAPAIFLVRGTITAGDEPAAVVDAVGGLEDRGEPCLEIMTGARFPDSGDGLILDACVRVEDVTRLSPCQGDACIAITGPIARYANRRLAGDDIKKGEVILRAGELIRPSHVLAIASVGIQSVVVARRPHIGIWSTGKELTSGPSTANDVNGPFLQAGSRAFGALPTFLGSLDDDLQAIALALREQSESRGFDVLLTSGGVSVGKFDFVRKALDYIGGRVIFHGVEIRPGYPALFALLPSRTGETAFFGLPGNPGAAAACFRFLVVPYLRSLLGQGEENPLLAKVESPGAGMKELPRSERQDRFSPGLLRVTERGENVVLDVGRSKGPAKMSPFISADCWIHFRPGQRADMGQVVCCYTGGMQR